MDVDTVVSGFIGSFLGVTAGFLGAVYLDWRHTRRQRRAHILALVREILSNNVRVRLVLKEGRREGGLEDRAWHELRVPLAGELPSELYNRLASRYDGIGAARKAYEELAGEKHDDEAADSLRRWADGMMEESEWLRSHVDGSAESLLRALNRRMRRQEERQQENDRAAADETGAEAPR